MFAAVDAMTTQQVIAFLVPLHLCEVAIRNAVADAIAAQYGPRWPWARGFQASLLVPPTGYNPRADLAGARRNTSSTGKVIPELKFVFWQKMLTSRYDNAIWNHQLATVLPGADASIGVPALRARVYNDLDRIRPSRISSPCAAATSRNCWLRQNTCRRSSLTDHRRSNDLDIERACT